MTLISALFISQISKSKVMNWKISLLGSQMAKLKVVNIERDWKELSFLYQRVDYYNVYDIHVSP